ncbi:histidine-rich protein PFHRP-II-like [Sitodiplosis mosellana]|uniref:histidine-rich protein PFHRP-II-like n=1 Tax=Sitodiplosis mosellana TaxID=263140 RepID=UPI002444022A|nr:histidine-rich protein PFHRP-II-like [Sitodiplosis mosellana]
MKFLVGCMFALVTTSIAGETKREKRGVLHGAHAFPHHELAHGLPAGHAHITPLIGAHAIHSAPLTNGSPLAAVSGFVHAPVLDQLNAAHLVHPAPAIPIAAAPAIAPIVHEQAYIGVAIQHHHEQALALHAAPVAVSAHGHLTERALYAGAPLEHHHHHHGAVAHHF